MRLLFFLDFSFVSLYCLQTHISLIYFSFLLKCPVVAPLFPVDLLFDCYATTYIYQQEPVKSTSSNKLHCESWTVLKTFNTVLFLWRQKHGLGQSVISQSVRWNQTCWRGSICSWQMLTQSVLHSCILNVSFNVMHNQSQHSVQKQFLNVNVAAVGSRRKDSHVHLTRLLWHSWPCLMHYVSVLFHAQLQVQIC